MKESKKPIKKQRNTSLIIMGFIVLILATVLKANSIGLSIGVILDILQAIGLIMILMGFGVSWTKKDKQK